jgi:hypothetical protein
MYYCCEHLVPKTIYPEYKETRTTLAEDLITMVDQDVDFSNNIITVSATVSVVKDKNSRVTRKSLQGREE